MQISNKAGINLFYGDDEFAIREELNDTKTLIGESSTVGLNYIEVDGKTTNFDILRNATQSMPFLSDYKLVVLNNPLSLTRSPSDRDTLKNFLKNIPLTTILLLVIIDEKERGDWKIIKNDHWLLRYLEEYNSLSPGRLHVREFSVPRGPELVKLLHREYEGKIHLDAINRLIDLIGEEPRIARIEIEKLMAYVNYQRMVEVSDVENLTTYIKEENIFDFVDALGYRNGKEAINILTRLLEKQDWQSVFGMMVRQFRLLLQTREILEFQGRENDVYNKIRGVSGNKAAKKLILQSMRFNLNDLENIYRHLINIDEDIKTGKVEAETSLYSFIGELTQ